MRVIIDLVVNHTSDEHPWFQSARARPGLAVPRLVRLVATTEPPDRHQGMVFPGEQDETWTYDEDGRRLVLPPLLRLPARPQHRRTRRSARRSRRSWAFWLQLGVAGFRDGRRAVHHRAHRAGRPERRAGLPLLDDLRDGPVVAHAATPSMLARGQRRAARSCVEYFGDRRRRPAADAVQLHRSTSALFLALARREARADRRGAAPRRRQLPRDVPVGDVPAQPRRGRSRPAHDEPAQRGASRRSGRSEDMQLYGRGIRRRLAPMLGGDRRRIEMAYAPAVPPARHAR